MADYLNVVYDSNLRPKTTYPAKLVSYLFDTYKMKRGQKFLEPGCGRGEFLEEFKRLGLECYGIDLSEQAGSLCPEVEIKKKVDLENDVWPYPDNFFDIIYNKSVLEHIRNPDKFLLEAKRVLKPGGKILCLVPDWEANYKIYFDDFTHRSPFTSVALHDIYLITDFDNISIIKFRQLPIVWKYPLLNIFCRLISPFIPVRTKNKFLRWSRELMLIGYAEKK
ncbi:MAG: class I SAM-dependent methyltransferase [Bacteroidetes bacterium]|nr:class I SAM-dependent methyltransferase [Bacteroidota bacterium]